jgi:hypothetical protein
MGKIIEMEVLHLVSQSCAATLEQRCFQKKCGQSINPQYDTISRYYTNTGKLAFAGLAIGFF